MQRYKDRNGVWRRMHPIAVSPRNYELPTDYAKQVSQKQDQRLRYQQWEDHRKGIH